MSDNLDGKLHDKSLHLRFRDKLRHRGVKRLSVNELRFELSSNEFQIPCAFYYNAL